jgi:hypothetical protein
MPVLSSAAESIALVGLGASECASGSQVCIGATPTLVPYPITASRNANRSAGSDNCEAC